METRLFQHLPLGETGHLVLLEVVHLSFADDILDESNFHIDLDKLDPIARLAGNAYAGLGDQFELIRPK